MFGGQHELEIAVSELIQKNVPCADLVRYSNTGTEASLHALRLARGYTGRRKFIKFEGHYHGWSDSTLISTAPPLDAAGPRKAPTPVLESGGQSATVLEDVIILPWNDLDLLEKTVRQHSDELAAVITEPIMCNCTNIMPQEAYAEGMRRICSEYGVVLIYDEVITGFRYALGGAQEYLNVTPDLAIFAKSMGAGFPISCLAGKAELMELITRGEVRHSGTYNSNPIVMAAAWATLNELRQNRDTIYPRIYELGSQLATGLKQILEEHGIPALVQGPGPSFHISVTTETCFHDYRSALARDQATYARFVAALADRGIRSKTNGLWFLSAAHTGEDIAVTLEAAKQAAERVFG
jgi:glutamate-1-semialdehyde 2,1-aminomutase